MRHAEVQFVPLALPCGKCALHLQATTVMMLTAQTAGAHFMWFSSCGCCLLLFSFRVNLPYRYSPSSAGLPSHLSYTESHTGCLRAHIYCMLILECTLTKPLLCAFWTACCGAFQVDWRCKCSMPTRAMKTWSSSITVHQGPCSSLMYRVRAEATAPATQTTAAQETLMTATAAGRPSAGAAAALAMMTGAPMLPSKGDDGGRDEHHPRCTLLSWLLCCTKCECDGLRITKR